MGKLLQLLEATHRHHVLMLGRVADAGVAGVCASIVTVAAILTVWRKSPRKDTDVLPQETESYVINDVIITGMLAVIEYLFIDGVSFNSWITE